MLDCSGHISLYLPILPKLPSQCYSNGSGNLDNIGGNNKIEPQSPHIAFPTVPRVFFAHNPMVTEKT